jgi:hypothetical protein
MSLDEHTTQQEWSALLQKERLQRQNTLRVPIATRRKQIDEQIAYYKGMLQRNLLASITDNNETLLKKLIELRAIQTVYILLGKEEERGYLDEQTTQYEVEQYTRDCVLLAKSIGLS